jgi:hypothetical protein
MRYSSIIAAGLLVFGFAGDASAQAAQCFHANGTPFGPVYRMENPSPG